MAGFAGGALCPAAQWNHASCSRLASEGAVDPGTSLDLSPGKFSSMPKRSPHSLKVSALVLPSSPPVVNPAT